MEIHMKKIILTQEQIYRGSLILVNSSHRFQSEPEELLVPVLEDCPDILLQRCAVVLLNQLMREIHGWGDIVPVSGWRSRKEQQQIWDDSLQENGLAFTKKYVAAPGHSEHQTGLALDLGLKSDHIDFIRPDFPDMGICRTFCLKAAKYGFILRYPAGKESITGIGHEPWHFRYVGVPHAAIMAEKGLTLEEYTEFIKNYPRSGRPCLTQNGIQEIAVSYVRSSSPETVAEIDESHPYIVSGNNVDGFILTEYGGSALI